MGEKLLSQGLYIALHLCKAENAKLWLYGCSGCFEKERSALLDLKFSINHPNGTSLPLWRGTDCCSWQEVSCNSRTGRVVEICIFYERNEGLGDWHLNASLLAPFEELRRLDLSGNSIRAFIDEAGLCKLKNLRQLSLSNNEFEGTIPSCLSNLTNLRYLDLSNNGFSGKFPKSLIASLRSLSFFSIESNDFSGLLKLSSFAHLSKLKTIVLSNNDLEVETEYPPWNSSFQLEHLFLSNCKLNKRTGVIPHFLYSQHDLTQVDLSYNHLSGRFPVWLLENNTRLETLVLRNNSFSGTFQVPPNSSNTTLFSLDISNNNFSGQIPFDIGTLLPKLGWLNLSINSFQGSLPPSMGNMTEFVSLDLSHNKLSGEVPEHMVAGWNDMQLLRLSNNNFDGRLFSAYFNMTSLGSLYLDHNNFVGTIPPIISNDSSLSVLDIEDNNMGGRLSKRIGDLSGLSTLILSGNHFDGMVSSELCKLRELSVLDLSDNKLSGPIPSCSNLTNLMYIQLEMNAFSWLIPSALSRSSSIKLVNIRDNYIGGVLPTWIGGLSQLRILLLKGNNFHGHIPIELCQLKNLSLLDLSYNNLSGSLPSCINNLSFGRSVVLDGAYVIDDNSAMYLTPGEMIVAEFITKSNKYSYKGDILNYMSGIDLSCNRLTGEIPLEMGQLNRLHSLNLSHNQFSGPIPMSFKNLSLIESMDLSYNRLNGTIPSELTELTYLEIFSVAHNNLSGRTPDMKSQFATFSGSSYEGNALLCGAPLSKSCISTTPAIPAAEVEEEKDDNEDNRVSFYASFVGSYSVFLLGTILVLYFTSERRAMCFFHVVDSCILPMTQFKLTSAMAIHDPAIPNCLTKCGNVDISSPFGIGRGCFFQGFEVICNQSIPYLSSSNLQLLEILPHEVRVSSKNFMAESCYLDEKRTGQAVIQLPEESPYTISITKNMFVIIGCYAVGDVFSNGTDTSGCYPSCQGNESMVNSSRNGIGCCQVPLPSVSKNLCIKVYQIGPSITNCTYGFVVENGTYNFTESDLYGFNMNAEISMRLGWSVEIGDKNCSAANSSLCGANTHCKDSEDEHICTCLQGYEGNPYLYGSIGCRDIDECKTSPCVLEAKCQNEVPGFRCECPIGSFGDGRKDGNGCYKKNPYFKAALDGKVVEEGKMAELQLVADVASRCVRPKGEERPTMKEVGQELITLYNNHKPSFIIQTPPMSFMAMATLPFSFITILPMTQFKLTSAMAIHDSAIPNCLTKCGNVDISSPFGIGRGCFFQGFEVICNQSIPYLSSSNLQLLEILPHEVRVSSKNFIAKGCYLTDDQKVGRAVIQLPEESPYTISIAKNMFVSIVCYTEGEVFETDIDECKTSPCVLEAKCRNEVPGFRCECPIGSSGDGRKDGNGCYKKNPYFKAALGE
ncbi:wall-associated receptor kinase 5-like protein [Cinnamomum micranthum f. kanehirae]|uniref:Wall-associated receptor kinase 5-like protein n=1 Tax=Cinnamomum micranthum f. kanehirae TaxID=337451 RepID=A0A3S3PZ02_9MAGN|nr:wall-associated receptor kinase 5-like protein [Cinnamomum micranthum f. kanehirae]